MAALDAALGGGVVCGAIHALLASQEGTAAHSLALRVAARAAGTDKWLIYIDTTLDFYPLAAAQLGVPLERLVVIRTSSRADALWACEQTLRCGGVAAVVMPLPALDAYASRRLQLAAEAGRSLGLLICRAKVGGPTFAASRLGLDPLLVEARIDGGSCSARGRCLRVTIVKLRAGRVVEPFALELPEDDAGYPQRGAGSAPALQRASGGQNSIDSSLSTEAG